MWALKDDTEEGGTVINETSGTTHPTTRRHMPEDMMVTKPASITIQYVDWCCHLQPQSVSLQNTVFQTNVQ